MERCRRRTRLPPLLTGWRGVCPTGLPWLVLLPAAAARTLALAVCGILAELFARRLERAPCLVLGAAFLHVPDQPRQAFLLLGDVEPVDGLGESQVGVDARDDNARV